ncbi:MAG TPA: divergent polysaccharide deacetylase family protein [Dongiaceae bacterium]
MTVPTAAAGGGRVRPRKRAGPFRRPLHPLTALVFLAGAGLWLGWQAGHVDWTHLDWGRFSSRREVVIDIAPVRSPTEVEIALIRPAAPPQPIQPSIAEPWHEPPPTVESMLALSESPPQPEILAQTLARAGKPARQPTAAAASAPARSIAAPAAAGGTEDRQAALAPPAPILYPLSLPAWRRHARPFDINDPRPRIAIIIVGLGPLHAATTAAISRLPAEVTLSFDPYDQALPEWIGLAHAVGHEVMLDLPAGDEVPLETGGSVPLTISLDGAANPAQSADLQRLDWVAGRAGGYVGLAASNSALASSAAERGSVLQDMGRRGLLLLDTNPSDASLRGTSAFGLPRVTVDLDIDQRADSLSVDAQLAALEARARQTGFAVGLAKGYPVTIERLVEWSRGLQEKDLALAPESALASQEMANQQTAP